MNNVLKDVSNTDTAIEATLQDNSAMKGAQTYWLLLTITIDNSIFNVGTSSTTIQWIASVAIALNHICIGHLATNTIEAWADGQKLFPVIAIWTYACPAMAFKKRSKHQRQQSKIRMTHVSAPLLPWVCCISCWTCIRIIRGSFVTAIKKEPKAIEPRW
mmetsp:Transcript_42444/g.84393  ORF Transcript_42444/g.84393 Transcript_42444/m.84393 type:complete len:159 (-) Transcript_42444:382-858(-)